MAVASDKVRAEFIDSQMFWDLTRKYKAAAIPKTFFNYEDSFLGVEDEQKMLGRVLQAGK